MLLSKKIYRGFFFFLIYILFTVAVILLQFRGTSSATYPKTITSKPSLLDNKDKVATLPQDQAKATPLESLASAAQDNSVKSTSDVSPITESEIATSESATQGAVTKSNEFSKATAVSGEEVPTEQQGRLSYWQRLTQKVSRLTQRVKVEREKEPPIEVVPVENKVLPFKFADIEGVTGIEKTFSQVVSNLTGSILNGFASYNLQPSDAGDKVALAFCALSGAAKKVGTLNTLIPSSYTKSSARSFRLTPLLSGLVSTQWSLTSTVKSYDSQLAAPTDIYKLLENSELLDYLAVVHKSAGAQSFIKKVAAIDTNTINAIQAAAVLESYAHLFERSCAEYKALTDISKSCASVLEAAITLDEGQVLINNSNLTAADIVKIGIALYSYGKATGDENIKQTGEHIFTSYYKNLTDNMELYCDLYTLLSRSNTYYPRFILLEDTDSPIWVYGAPNSIKFTRGVNNTGNVQLTITSDYDAGESQYLFFSGIKAFRSIYIYEVAFRSDNRFEVYNSSGYVYKMDSHLFLLKSRHRTKSETIRLIYGQ